MSKKRERFGEITGGTRPRKGGQKDGCGSGPLFEPNRERRDGLKKNGIEKERH